MICSQKNLNSLFLRSKEAYLGQSIQEWTKEILWKTAFKKFEGVWSAQRRTYPFEFCKGCLPQILLGSLLNTLPHLGHFEGSIRSFFHFFVFIHKPFPPQSHHRCLAWSQICFQSKMVFSKCSQPEALQLVDNFHPNDTMHFFLF